MIRRHGQLPRQIFLAADTLGAVIACLLAYWVRIGSGWLPVVGRTDVLPARYLHALPVAVLALVLCSVFAGTYRDDALARGVRLTDAIKISALAGVVLAALALGYRDVFEYSRLALGFAALLYLPVFLIGRVVAERTLARLRRSGRLRTSAAVIGGGRPAAALHRTLASNPWLGVDVVATSPVGGETTTDGREPGTALPGRRIDVGEVLEMARDGRVDEVYVALPAARADAIDGILEQLDETTASVRIVPDLGAAVSLNPSANVLGGLAVVSLREGSLYGVRAVSKRAVDVALSAVLLVLTAPVMGLVALLVKLTSPGPALYRQERMGLDARPFSMLKFRTMRVDAESETGPVFAARGDPRVTPVGRVLRRLSLDELPQLWNVFRGDMSLVGPRPERRTFIEEFRKSLSGYMLRHSVKAGMTGWAQVHGLRGNSSLEERLRFDLEYIDRWSLSLDLEILGRTAVHVVLGRNAY